MTLSKEQLDAHLLIDKIAEDADAGLFMNIMVTALFYFEKTFNRLPTVDELFAHWEQNGTGGKRK